MKLFRQNILTLIGSGRYQSCILTTFSFDFYFFELKVMKYLRSAGVRNVNVLIDGHYYAELMKDSTGEELQQTPSYSLYPIFHSSIFHPKIWMFFGKKEGLLVVGSGNLTNSGNGGNDEIWGAFHFDITSSSNSAIFSAAWNYLNSICSTLQGQIKEKTTSRILEQSKWVNELPAYRPFHFESSSKTDKIALLYNSGSSSIWNELSRLLKKEKITEITSISPYYDKNGNVLQELHKMFPKAIINVIIDENGLIPVDLPFNNSFRFYTWNDAGVCRGLFAKYDNVKSKLHAKIVHFKTKNGTEYYLFGSANVTPEGIGLLSPAKSHIELSVFVKTEKSGILKELGLNFDEINQKKLSEFKSVNTRSVFQSILVNNKSAIQILAAELLFDEIKIFTNGKYVDALKVKIWNNQNELVYTQKLKTFAPEQIIKPKAEIPNMRYLQFTDTAGQPVSNKIIITDYALVAKTFLNSKYETIGDISLEVQSGNLSRVLDLLNNAIIDETEDDYDDTNNSHGSSSSERPEKTTPGLNDLSDYAPKEHYVTGRDLLLQSPSLRILEILKFAHLAKQNAAQTKDIRPDEQETELGSLDGVSEEELGLQQGLVSSSTLAAEQHKVLHYFNKMFHEVHCHKLYPEDKFECNFSKDEIAEIKNKYKNYRVTLTDLTKYLIALELVFEYGGKFEKCVNHNLEEYFNFLPQNGDSSNSLDDVKGLCLNLLGDFLMLIGKKGFREYGFEYTSRKLAQSKFDALVDTIVCVLNIRWKEDEMCYMYSLILNALHYLGWSKPSDFDKNIDNLILNIEAKINALKHPTSFLSNNYRLFRERICPAFIGSIKKRECHDFDVKANKGDMIYSSVVGYCFASVITDENEFSLIRPGFMWDEVKEDYFKFLPDKFYKPIKLTSFIVLDL